MSATTAVKRRRPLIWWGAGLMLAALVGLVAVILMVMRIGGGLIDDFSADAHPTPAQITMQLDEGTYCIYERSGTQRNLGPLE